MSITTTPPMGSARRPSLDGGIARLASTQHGAFTRAQAFDLGATRSAIAARLDQGRWVRRHDGVYLIGRLPCCIDGVRVTDRPSTIVDLAGVMRRGRFTQVLDDQLSSHQVELPDVIRAFEAQARRGRRGIAMLRELLEARASGVAATPSELERVFRELVLPSVTHAATFEFLPAWREDGIGRADCVFVDERLIAELDGRRWHLRDVDFEADRRRDQDALERRWRTVRYTHAQITKETARVATNLRRILELGAPRHS